ncbi:MAG TPA: hypothetical protein VJ438_01865 [Candidatus Nanoarchaeia archaeon]|nr:hypothetical protein [Candidatus Nanoarchaeia archaeon]
MNSNLNAFREYCEEYQNVFSPKESSQKHDKLVKRILKNPMLIQLRGVQYSYKEVRLVGPDKVGRIDLIFITDEEIPYICEVKSSSRVGKGTETQLERYYEYIKKKFGIFPTRIGVHLNKTGGLTKRIIPIEIRDLLELIPKNNIEESK